MSACRCHDGPAGRLGEFPSTLFENRYGTQADPGYGATTNLNAGDTVLPVPTLTLSPAAQAAATMPILAPSITPPALRSAAMDKYWPYALALVGALLLVGGGN